MSITIGTRFRFSFNRRSLRIRAAPVISGKLKSVTTKSMWFSPQSRGPSGHLAQSRRHSPSFQARVSSCIWYPGNPPRSRSLVGFWIVAYLPPKSAFTVATATESNIRRSAYTTLRNRRTPRTYRAIRPLFIRVIRVTCGRVLSASSTNKNCSSPIRSIQRSIPYRFRNMRRADAIIAFKICNRPTDFQNSIVSAS